MPNIGCRFGNLTRELVTITAISTTKIWLRCVPKFPGEPSIKIKLKGCLMILNTNNYCILVPIYPLNFDRCTADLDEVHIH